MNGKVIALILLLSISAPLASHARATDILEDNAIAELGLERSNPDTILDEVEGNKLEKMAVAAATGAAIGSVWPGPGTALGFVVGGIYGFFFR